MKKFFYFTLATILFASLTSCSTEEDDVIENSGNISGIWGIVSVTGSVETGNVLANAALNIALQTYASSNEPDGYVFDSSNSTFEYYYINNNSEISDSGSGTYTLTTDSLFLTYSGTGTTESYGVITLNDSVLKIRKDYLSDFTSWGLSILEGYSGVTVSSATATATYNISN